MHDPKYLYDCDNCKYSWCCGPTCHCDIGRQKPGIAMPPIKRREEVDAARIANGCTAERWDE
jgi:hypothetical protein